MPNLLTVASDVSRRTANRWVKDSWFPGAVYRHESPKPAAKRALFKWTRNKALACRTKTLTQPFVYGQPNAGSQCENARRNRSYCVEGTQARKAEMEGTIDRPTCGFLPLQSSSFRVSEGERVVGSSVEYVPDPTHAWSASTEAPVHTKRMTVPNEDEDRRALKFPGAVRRD